MPGHKSHCKEQEISSERVEVLTGGKPLGSAIKGGCRDGWQIQRIRQVDRECCTQPTEGDRQGIPGNQHHQPEGCVCWGCLERSRKETRRKQWQSTCMPSAPELQGNTHTRAHCCSTRGSSLPRTLLSGVHTNTPSTVTLCKDDLAPGLLLRRGTAKGWVTNTLESLKHCW